MEIIHIPYKDIDREKWDRCIAQSKHSSLYNTSFYADAIAGKWDALVLGDYEMVMPLYHRKKAGIKYLYQPAFLPHISIFSVARVDEAGIKAFIDKAFNVFNFAEINIYFPEHISVSGKNMAVKKRNNYVVDLTHSYQKSNFAPGFIKSLNRLQKLSLQYAASDDVKEITDLFNTLYLEKIGGLKKSDVKKFRGLCISMQDKNNTVIRKAYSADYKLLCAVLLLKFGNRLYNMMSCITPAGKKAEANYFLYDRLIEEFSGKDMVLDLEGSDIKGIADFYLKMNPGNEPYYFIRYNNLNRFVKLFKK